MRRLVFVGLAVLIAGLVVSAAVLGAGRGPLPARPGLFVADQNGHPPAVLPADEPLDQPFAVKLSGVPAWTWCYGCANTAAGMIMGYYDRHGYPNMYAGNAGDAATAVAGDVAEGASKLCPLNNEIAWPDHFNDPTLGESPLAACHKGIDGRTERGYVDECWIGSESGAPDPWITNGWTLHDPPCCVADTMWTSRYDKYNIDGATQFILASLGDPVQDYTGYEPDLRDGSHGMRLYAESRGYAVEENFNQLILPTPAGHHNPWGFTFDDYKAEIDAGRPVLLMAGPHAFVGFGYAGDDTCYIRSTWDNGEHTMTWGGRYGGYEHWAVSVFKLEGPPPDTYPDLLVRTPSDSGFQGDGVYNDLGHQSLTRPTKPKTALTYQFTIQNDATVADTITIKGTAGEQATATPIWTVKYLKDLSGTTDLTDSVTSATGWQFNLGKGRSKTFRAVVTPNGAVPEGASYAITVSATSLLNPRRNDAWQLTTVRRRNGVESTIYPSAVPQLTATRATGATQATITFPRCTEDNWACTKYNVYRQCLSPTGSLTRIKVVTATGAASYTVTDTGCGATKPYNYTVKAANGAKQSAGTTAPLLDPAVTPAAPTKLSARRVNGDATSAKFTWTKSPDDPNGVAYYAVYRRCTTDGTAWEELGTVARSGTASTYAFNDSYLNEYKAYQYGVRAYNGAKASSRPTCALKDAKYDPTVTPRDPTDLIASRNSSIGMTRAQLTLYKSPDDDSGCTEYTIYRRTIPPPYGAWEEVTTIPATGAAQYTYTDTGLGNTTNYQYAAVAYNGTLASGAEVTVLTDPTVTPGPPASLTLENSGTDGTAVDVTFGASPNDPRGVTDYGVFIRTVNPDTAWQQIAQGTADGSSEYGFTMGGLTPGQEYAFAVIAVNNANQSDYTEAGITPEASSSVVARASAVPTAAGAQVVVTLSADANLSVEVMNVAGRSVRRLCSDRACVKGQNTLLWDARSEAGTRVPAGRYLVRIVARAGDGSQSQALATVTLTR